MIVTVIVEDPKGSTERHVWDSESRRWTTYAFPHTSNPWPAHYGFIPGTLNPADGDELDVLLLSTADLRTGDSVEACAVGLLMRPDNDHKVLAVALDDPDVAHVTRFTEVPPGDLRSIEDWFRSWSEPPAWLDEVHARSLIESARANVSSSDAE